MRFVKLLTAAFAALWMSAVAMPVQAATFFIDTTLGDVPADQVVAIAEPKPVQIVFQFATNGSPNARATNYLKDQVTEVVTQRGLFSQVSPDPVEGGAILSITLNNVPQADAARRGFTAGLTFGLNGTVVADYYEAQIEYVSGPGAETVTKTARHTLFTRVGRDEDPPNTVRVRNAEEGIRTVTRQVLQHMLNDLAKDPAFNPNAPPPVDAVAQAAAGVEVSTAETVSAEPAPAAEPEPVPAPN